MGLYSKQLDVSCHFLFTLLFSHIVSVLFLLCVYDGIIHPWVFLPVPIP